MQLRKGKYFKSVVRLLTNSNSHFGLLLIVFVAVLARVLTLGDQSFWMDEFLTAIQANIIAKDNLPQVSLREHVSPLYNLLSAAMVRLSLDNEFWLRLPSALAGIAAVPMAWLLANRLFGAKNLGLATAFILAVSPFAIWYAQEARSYSILMLLSMIVIYQSWPALTESLKPRVWLLLVCCTTAGFYAHPYFFITSSTFGLFLLFAKGIRDKQFWVWSSTQIVGFGFFLIWFSYAYAADSTLSGGSAKPMIVMWIPYTLFTFVAGFSLGPTIAELKSANLVSLVLADLPLFLVVGFAAAGIFYMGLRNLLQRNRLATIWCLVWLFVPMLLVIAISFVTNISYNVRYVIAAYPAVAMVAAGAFSAIGQNSRLALISVAAVLAVSFYSLFNWYTDPRYAKADVRSAAQILNQWSGDNSVWVVGNGFLCEFLWFYQADCPDSAVIVNGQADSLSNAKGKIVQLTESGRGDFILLEYRPWEHDPNLSLRRQIEGFAEKWRSVSWGAELAVTQFRMTNFEN